jgi:hypothetical protein
MDAITVARVRGRYRLGRDQGTNFATLLECGSLENLVVICCVYSAPRRSRKHSMVRSDRLNSEVLI